MKSEPGDPKGVGSSALGTRAMGSGGVGAVAPLSLLIVNPMGGDGWGGVERWFMDVFLAASVLTGAMTSLVAFRTNSARSRSSPSRPDSSSQPSSERLQAS